MTAAWRSAAVIAVVVSCAASASAATTPPDRSYRKFHLGPSSMGLPMTLASRFSMSTGIDDESQHETSYVYGTCDTNDGGCSPPLSVTSSPLCEAHLALYADGPAPPAYRRIRIKGVPAVSYDEGRTIEIYTARTTISVYARTARKALAAARSVRPAASIDVPAVGGTLDRIRVAGTSPARLPRPDARVLAQRTACP